MTIPTTRRRRPTTAAKAAAALGVSVSTIYRYVSERREDYEGTAQARREAAGTMRKNGASWSDIAAAVGGSEWAARALVRRFNEGQKQGQSLGKPTEKRLSPKP